MDTTANSADTEADTYITFSELRAKLKGRARSSIYQDIEAGRLPKPMKLGNRNYWVNGGVDAAMAKLQDA